MYNWVEIKDLTGLFCYIPSKEESAQHVVYSLKYIKLNINLKLLLATQMLFHALYFYFVCVWNILPNTMIIMKFN